MSWLETQLALLNAATAVVQFGVNWFLQSALLIAIGLATGRLLALRGSAVQSAIYRTTLLAVLICPLASCLLSLAGVSGWSLATPRPWTGEPAGVTVAGSASSATESTAASRPAVARAVSVSTQPRPSESPLPEVLAFENPRTPATDSPAGDLPLAVAGEPPIEEPAMPPAESPTISVHAFGWVALAVAAAWLMVSSLLFARLALGWWRMTQLRGSAESVDVLTWQICHELATQLAVTAPEVLRSPYLPSPCLAGIRRPVVLLPGVDLSLSMRDVLVHELAHLARRDCHWNLLRISALAAFFFQPLLWVLSRRLEVTAEEVCDDYVVQFGGDRLEYAFRLVDIAELCSAPMAAAGVGIVSLRSMLAQRIERIVDPSRSLSTRVGSLLLTIVLAAGLLGTVSVGLIGISPKQSIAEGPSSPSDGQTSNDRSEPATAFAVVDISSASDSDAGSAGVTRAAIGAVAAESSATPPSPVEAAAGPSLPEVAATVVFERDPVQLTPGPFDVWSLAFSADDRFLAAGGGGGWDDQNVGQARIWDFAKATEIASYPTMRGVESVALSPDGRRVALGSWSGDIWLREVGGAELMHEKFEAPLRVAISPDGKLLVGVTERAQLRTWDGVTGKLLEKKNDADGNAIENPEGAFRGGTFPFFWVGFSPDGKYLVACGGKKNEVPGVKFAVWSVASRQQLYKKTVHLDRIFAASISPDSQTLATTGENSVVLWDLATGTRRSETDDTGGQVCRVEFSPDGKLLASVSYGKGNDVVTLWDPSTTQVVGTLAGHASLVRGIAFTRDGKTVATGGADRSVRLWDVATRQQKSILQGPKSTTEAPGAPVAITAVAYSPDGSAATASEDGQVTIYGPLPFGLARSWNAHVDATATLAFSPDGKTLVTAGYDKLVKFWNPETGELLRTLTGHTGWVVSLAFSHDGQTLASGSYDRSIRLWNVADGVERHKLTGHAATIRSLAFSHDDKLLASGSADHTVRLWDAAGGVEQARLSGHEAGVRGVAFSADDRLLASGGEDQTIKVWNADSHDLRGTLTGHSDIVSSVAFVQQMLVSTSWDKTLRSWDVSTLKQLSKHTVGPSEVVAMSVAPDGRRLLTASADQSLVLWKSTAVEGQRSGSLGDYRTFPWVAEFSPDGSTLAVAAGGFAEESDLYLYDVATRAEKYKVTFPGSVRSIAFAPAGDVIALGFARKKLLLVDAATGREVAQLEEQPADAPAAPRVRYTRVAFSPDGKLLASASYDDDIRIYDVEHRALVKTLRGRKDRILAFAFSPDQTQLMSCSAGKPAVIWELENAEKRLTLPLPGNVGVASVSFSPDGKLLATGSSNDICCIRDAETGSVLQTLKAHAGIVFESVFSPDGKMLATSGEDGLVKLWDVATGKLLRTYNCQSGRVLCVRFSPDGKSFATTGRDGQARLWWVLPPETN